MKVTIVILLIITGFVSPAQYKTLITVAKDGTGDYRTIQNAINAAKAFPDLPVTIRIKNGIYKEKVKVHAWNTNLSIIGENRDQTIITYHDHFDKINLGRNSTFHTYTMLVEANDFRAENLTIVNDAGPVGQAVALHVDADRVVFTNCNVKGHQDALYVAGESFRQYFRNCHIEGTTDFIFGAATAVFDECTIHSKSDSFITAASTPEGVDFGFVFIDCKLTADRNVSAVYLGRPWRAFARTVFIRCQMGYHILPEGWHNWNNAEKEKTAFYAEYESRGAGANEIKRVTWSHVLTDTEANMYSLQNIFSGWNPAYN